MSNESYHYESRLGSSPVSIDNDLAKMLPADPQVAQYGDGSAQPDLWKIRFTEEEFRLLWAFLLYVRSNYPHLFVQIAADGTPEQNCISETDLHIDLQILGAIVHRFVWGSAGNISSETIFQCGAGATTLQHRYDVEAKPAFWVDKVRQAYAAWRTTDGSSFTTEDLPQEIMFCMPNGQLRSDFPSSMEKSVPDREPAGESEYEHCEQIYGINALRSHKDPLSDTHSTRRGEEFFYMVPIGDV